VADSKGDVVASSLRHELSAEDVQALFSAHWPKMSPPNLVACYPVAVAVNAVAIGEFKAEGKDPRPLPGGSPFVSAPDSLALLKAIRRPAHKTRAVLRAARDSVASRIVGSDADEWTRNYFQTANDSAATFVTAIDRVQQALDELLALPPPASYARKPAHFLQPRIAQAWNTTDTPPRLGIGRESPLVKFIAAALAQAGWPRTPDQISNELRKVRKI
jgi:hypothetical protein